MPHLHESKIKFLEETASDNTSDKTAEDIQDAMFRKMSVARKIKLASDFFRFAKKLHTMK